MLFVWNTLLVLAIESCSILKTTRRMEQRYVCQYISRVCCKICSSAQFSARENFFLKNTTSEKWLIFNISRLLYIYTLPLTVSKNVCTKTPKRWIFSTTIYRLLLERGREFLSSLGLERLFLISHSFERSSSLYDCHAMLLILCCYGCCQNK